MGKHVVFHMEGELFLVFHLMIAGRFQWRDAGAGIPGKIGLAAFDFLSGTLLLTEAGSKKRASLHIVIGSNGLQRFDRGGIDILDAGRGQFAAALTRENHTLKRALTDPRLFSGIGNSYSDEILHAAKLSPLKLTARLTEEEIGRLCRACRDVLLMWTERLRSETGDGFPAKVTAFRKEMAVHGKYGMPCPVCGTAVQRIVYSENECNYCPECQTGGKILADRSLSRVLKGDWPRSMEELEELQSGMPLGEGKKKG
jgi:formamidopyrimidine-DNA glycosylase